MAPHNEEQAPPSGDSLALPPSISYLKDEQPVIELKGSGLTNALGSESPGDAIHLKFADSVAHSAADTNIDERDPYFAP